MYVCTEAVHTYIAKRANSPMYGPVPAISSFTHRSKSGVQIGTIQEHLQKFFGLCRCGGTLYTFVPQTAKGWQPVLLGTNCQPFFVAYAALQGHLVVRRAGRNRPTQLPSAAQRYKHTRLWFQSRVPRNPGAVSLDSSGAKGRRSGPGRG